MDNRLNTELLTSLIDGEFTGNTIRIVKNIEDNIKSNFFELFEKALEKSTTITTLGLSGITTEIAQSVKLVLQNPNINLSTLCLHLLNQCEADIIATAITHTDCRITHLELCYVAAVSCDKIIPVLFKSKRINTLTLEHMSLKAVARISTAFSTVGCNINILKIISMQSNHFVKLLEDLEKSAYMIPKLEFFNVHSKSIGNVNSHLKALAKKGIEISVDGVSFATDNRNNNFVPVLMNDDEEEFNLSPASNNNNNNNNSSSTLHQLPIGNTYVTKAEYLKLEQKVISQKRMILDLKEKLLNIESYLKVGSYLKNNNNQSSDISGSKEEPVNTNPYLQNNNNHNKRPSELGQSSDNQLSNKQIKTNLHTVGNVKQLIFNNNPNLSKKNITSTEIETGIKIEKGDKSPYNPT